MSRRLGWTTVPLGAFFQQDIASPMTLPAGDTVLYLGMFGLVLFDSDGLRTVVLNVQSVQRIGAGRRQHPSRCRTGHARGVHRGFGCISPCRRKVKVVNGFERRRHRATGSFLARRHGLCQLPVSSARLPRVRQQLPLEVTPKTALSCPAWNVRPIRCRWLSVMGSPAPIEPRAERELSSWMSGGPAGPGWIPPRPKGGPDGARGAATVASDRFFSALAPR